MGSRTLIVKGAVLLTIFCSATAGSPSSAQETPPAPTPAKAEENVLLEFPAKSEPASLSIGFNIHARERCSFGDMEALIFDLMASGPETKVLLSLEPLDDKSLSPAVADITNPGKISPGGVSTAISVPLSDQPHVYGLYLCKDAKGENRCSGKEVMQFQEMINPYRKGNKLDKNYRASDKVYFFQFLVVSEGKVYYPHKYLGDPDYTKLENELTALGFKNKQLPTIIKRIREVNDVLGSMKLLALPDALQIDLPKFAKERCS